MSRYSYVSTSRLRPCYFAHLLFFSLAQSPLYIFTREAASKERRVGDQYAGVEVPQFVLVSIDVMDSFIVSKSPTLERVRRRWHPSVQLDNHATRHIVHSSHFRLSSPLSQFRIYMLTTR